MDIEKEIFCTNLELKIFSKLVIDNELERFLPGFAFTHTELEHQLRYDWLKQFVDGKEVLDIACGSGFGTKILSSKAKRVIGCDIDKDIIKYASYRYSNNNIEYRIENVENFKLDNKLDTIISFETIEHLKNVDDYLKNIDNNLKEDGNFFVSTPISNKKIDSNPNNIFHIQEWGFTEFHKLIQKYFDIEEVYIQLHPFQLNRSNILKVLLKPTIYNIKNTILFFINFFNKKDLSKSLKVIKYNNKKIPKYSLGSTHIGYQILKCKKK